MEESKRIYQRNYYINRRNYVLNLVKIPKNELTDKQKIDLDKYIDRFCPKSARVLRNQGSNIAKDEKNLKLKKEWLQSILINT